MKEQQKLRGKRGRKITALLMAAAMSVMLFAGCGSESASTTAAEQPAQAVSAQLTTADTAQEAEVFDDADEQIIGEAEADETAAQEVREAAPDTEEPAIDINGTYTSKEDVALYLYTYEELPSNFITKKEARELGWNGGSLEPYAPGMCIGGDRFGNYEEVLPDGTYHECDIDTLGAQKRGAKRLVYSEDGRIYYTEDHYETFELLYGEE